MKKSEFIEKVLKHPNNTVFVDEAIVERAIEVFEDLGMMPPPVEGKVEVGSCGDGSCFVELWYWED